MEISDLPFYDIVTNDLMITDYRVYRNYADDTIQFRTTCPFCGGVDTLNINMVSGYHTCWRASCEHKGGRFASLYAGMKGISYSEASLIVRSKVPALTSTSKTIGKLDFDIGWLDTSSCSVTDAIQERFAGHRFDRVTPDHPDWMKYSNWVSVVRSPGYDPEYFFDRFEVYSTDLFPESKRGIFKITTNDVIGYLAYALDRSVRPKTLNPKSNVLSHTLFNYNDLVRDDWLFVVEGVFTAARAILVGYDAVAAFGTSISYRQLELIKAMPHRNVVFLYDYGAIDKAEKNAKRYAANFIGKQVYWNDTPFTNGTRYLDLDDIGNNAAKQFLDDIINGKEKIHKV